MGAQSSQLAAVISGGLGVDSRNGGLSFRQYLGVLRLWKIACIDPLSGPCTDFSQVWLVSFRIGAGHRVEPQPHPGREKRECSLKTTKGLQLPKLSQSQCGCPVVATVDGASGKQARAGRPRPPARIVYLSSYNTGNPLPMISPIFPSPSDLFQTTL